MTPHISRRRGRPRPVDEGRKQIKGKAGRGRRAAKEATQKKAKKEDERTRHVRRRWKGYRINGRMQRGERGRNLEN